MFVAPDLAHRIDLAEARLVAAIVSRIGERRPDVRAFATPVAGGWALFAGRANPVNKVIGIGFDTVPDEAAFAAVERAFRERGAEARAEVATLARAETHEWLSRRGYVLQGFENVLGRSLEPVTGPGADRPDEPGVSGSRAAVDTVASTIDVRVVSAEEVDAWVATVTEGFAAPDLSGAGGDQPLPPADDLATMMDDAFRADGVTRYVARMAGGIAGGASMRLDGDVALLAGAATLPAFRRRGVQRALLRARLADAARAGCARAIVVTQPGTTSQANAQRQGFHLLYARALLVQK